MWKCRPAVEFLRVSFPHQVESVCNGGVNADGKVAVDDVARDWIEFTLRILRAAELDLPPVHHHHRAVADVVQNLLQVLAIIT